MKGKIKAAILVLALISVVGGCTYKHLDRYLVKPERLKSGKAAGIKFHMWDGSVYVAESIKVEGDYITFKGSLYSPSRRLVEKGRFKLHKDSIALVEVNEYSLSLNKVRTLLITVDVVMCAISWTPLAFVTVKAAFGSCPVYYTYDGHRWNLEAEGFSMSIAKSLMETDIDMLERTPPAGTLSVVAKNEALETQYIVDQKLILVEKGEDEEVYTTPDERAFLRVKNERPVKAFLTEDGNRTDMVKVRDGYEYRSWADSNNLLTPETLRVRIEVERAGRKGLVITYRQTLMTTFLLYQSIAYMGWNYPKYLKMLEEKGKGSFRKRGVFARFGKLKVILNGEVMGEISEVGPIAHNNAAVDLGYLNEGEYEVLLVGTKGFWKIDYVGVADVVGEGNPVVISPFDMDVSGIQRGGVGKEFPVILLPGDTVVFRFDLSRYSGRSYRLFLASTGYYYEWQRKEWVKEENPVMLALLYTLPDVYFRLLTPKYKEVERALEEGFWNSKYERKGGL